MRIDHAEKTLKTILKNRHYRRTYTSLRSKSKTLLYGNTYHGHGPPLLIYMFVDKFDRLENHVVGSVIGMVVLLKRVFDLIQSKQ